MDHGVPLLVLIPTEKQPRADYALDNAVVVNFDLNHKMKRCGKQENLAVHTSRGNLPGFSKDFPYCRRKTELHSTNGHK